jgi:hypothetical protein
LPPTPKISNYDARHQEDTRYSNSPSSMMRESQHVFNEISKEIASLSRHAGPNPTQEVKDTIDALNELRDSIRGNGTGNTNLKVDANLNVTGFDGVGKSVAFKEIAKIVLENIAGSLNEGPQEQLLAIKLRRAIRAIDGKEEE